MNLSLDQRKQKWIDFLDAASSQRTIILVNCDEGGPGARPWPYPENWRKRMDWAVDACNAQRRRAQWLDDDRIPAISPYTGTEIFAEALGCKVHYSGDNMPFALPRFNNIAEAERLRVPEMHDTPLYDLFELAQRIRQRVDDDAVMQLPDIQSPLDIAALVLRKSEFLMAMLENPDAVLELVGKTQKLLTDFLDEWFRTFGIEYIAHFPDYFMRGGVTFSEDEVGEFSTDMYEKFCLGPINDLSERFGGCGMHCCANSRHQWSGFKKIKGLRLLNLIQGPHILNQVGDFFGGSICHWHGDGVARDPDSEIVIPEWIQNCGPKTHVVIERQADSRESAIALSRRLREAEKRRACA